MSLNATQKTTVVIAVIVLLLLLLFPPWRQAAEREKDYRLDIGRAFILQRPGPGPVDCYFVGCKTAPASYFHVLLYWDLLLQQLAAVAGVAIAITWLFRTRQGGRSACLAERKTRLVFSMLVALLVAPEGRFPLASDLLRVPKLAFHRDDFWLVGTIVGLFTYAFSGVFIYGLLSTLLWLRRKTGRSPGAPLLNHP